MGDDVEDDGRDLVVELDVWVCNLNAVMVFKLCPIDVVGGMGGWLWKGIQPSEIKASCEAVDVPYDRWIAADVHFMGSVVATERNLRQANASRRGRK